jgi:hypothetical protein
MLAHLHRKRVESTLPLGAVGPRDLAFPAEKILASARGKMLNICMLQLAV